MQVPGRVAETVATGGSWERLTCSDRVLRIVPREAGFPSKWVLLEVTFVDPGDAARLALLVETPSGADRLTPTPCGRAGKGDRGQKRFLVRLPEVVTGLALDLAGRGDFERIRTVRVKQIGSAGAALRFAAARAGASRCVDLPTLVRRAVSLYRREGLGGFRRRLGGSQSTVPADGYEQWLARNDALSPADRQRIRTHIQRLAWKPPISIILPVAGSEPDLLDRSIDSLRRQLYPHWVLCLLDDGLTESEITCRLRQVWAGEARIKHFRCGESKDGPGLWMRAARSDGAAFTAQLEPGDRLAEHALYLVVECINRHPDVALLYSDEDRIDQDGRRYDPYFKPDWDADLIFGQNYVSRLGVYRHSVLDAIGGCWRVAAGLSDHGFALRVTEAVRSHQIQHIPHILYHRGTRDGTSAHAGRDDQCTLDRAREALREHFHRRGICAEVLPSRSGRFHRVRFAPPLPRPKVSLIVPTRDRVDLLKVCLVGLLERTDYPDRELIVVDNDSREEATMQYFTELRRYPAVRVLSYPGPFNYSLINNYAVRQARGQLVGFMNNDLEVIHSDWLEELVSQVMRKGVGAVGALLYYPNDTVQHGGVVLGCGGVAAHAHINQPRGTPGYFGRAEITHEVSAATAACLLVHKHVFQAVGGLNETDLQVSYNDVDLCLKIRRQGYRILLVPHAELYHHESASRGDMARTQLDRFRAETRYMLTTWGDALSADRFYNPNLTLRTPPYGLARASRAGKPWLEPL